MLIYMCMGKQYIAHSVYFNTMHKNIIMCYDEGLSTCTDSS